jgi:hypothetical protein
MSALTDPRADANTEEPPHFHELDRGIADDRHAFMQGVAALPGLLGRRSLRAAAVTALMRCDTFDAVAESVCSFDAKSRKPLLNAAESLIRYGHVTAGRMLAALWTSFGASAVDRSLEEVAAMLPTDGQGRPVWPSACGEKLRRRQLGSHAGGGIRNSAFLELARELLNNPEGGG